MAANTTEEATMNTKTTSDGLTYIISENKIIITGYNGNEASVQIPAKIEDLNVTQVAIHHQAIEKISSPSNINLSAYNLNCPNLSEFYMRDDETGVGVSYLYGTPFLNCIKPVQLRLSNTVRGIGGEVGGTVHGIGSIEVSENNSYLQVIEDALYTKDGNTLMYFPPKSERKDLIIPEGVEYIYNAGLSAGGNLINITFPTTMKDIITESGLHSFQNLKNIYIKNPNIQKKRIDFLLAFSTVQKKNLTLHGYAESAVEEIALEYGINFVAFHTTSSDKRWEYSNYTNGLILQKYVGNETKIDIPKTLDGKVVIGIGKECFYKNNDINYISFPDTIKSIEEDALRGCSNIDIIYIPASVEKIGKNAFRDCLKLENIIFNGQNSQIDIDTGAFLNIGNYKLFAYSNMEINSSNINLKILQYKPVEAIDIMHSVLYIGQNEKCTVKFTPFDASIQKIKYEIIDGSENATIDQNGIITTKNIGNITIKITSLDNNKETIKTVNIRKISDDKLWEYTKEDDKIVITKYLGAEKKVIIPSSIDTHKVSNIYINAFKDNKNVECIYINENIEKIGESAFQNCTNLKYIILEGQDKQVSIDNEAFLNTANKFTLYAYKTLQIDAPTINLTQIRKEYKPVQSLSLTVPSIYLGHKTKVSIKLTPSDASIKQISYEIIDGKQNATISSDGIINPKKIGNIKVKVTSFDQNKSYQKTIAIKKLSVAKPSKVSAKVKKRKVTITVKKVSDSNGYILYQYSKSKKKYVIITKTNSASKTKFKTIHLKKKGTYYFKVAAYKKFGGKTYYSKLTSTKKVKISK